MARAAAPDPWLKRSANGGPPGPVWRYAEGDFLHLKHLLRPT